jgi:hypothetical protein
VGKAATEKIDVGGRNSRTAAATSVGSTRDPADSNRCACKLPMRRRSEEWGARGITNGEEARAVAMVRPPALQAVAMVCEGKKGAWELGVGRRGLRRGPRGA